MTLDDPELDGDDRHCFQILKGEGKRFLVSNLICTYTLSEYISDIYVDGLCIISVKRNFETRRDITYSLQTK